MVRGGRVLDQREQIGACEPLTAAEERQLDDEAGSEHLAADLLDQILDRLDRPTRREHVVMDHDLEPHGIRSGCSSSAFSPYSST